MARRGAELLPLARGRPEAQAVLGGAEVRATLDDLPLAVPAGRRAAGGPRPVRRRRPAGARPLPDVAADVEQPVGVGRERIDRRRAAPAVGGEILIGERPLPPVGDGRAPAPARRPTRTRCPRARPRPRAPIRSRSAGPCRPSPRRRGRPRTRCASPDGARACRRRSAARRGDPSAPRERSATSAASRRAAPAPRCRRRPASPRRARRDRRRGPRRRRRRLRDRDVPGLAHEAAELGDRHRVAIHPESLDLDIAQRPLLGVEVLGTQRRSPAGDPDHVGSGLVCGCPLLGAHAKVWIVNASAKPSVVTTPTSLPPCSICLGHHRVGEHRQDRARSERQHERDRVRRGVVEQRIAGERGEAGDQRDRAHISMIRDCLQPPATRPVVAAIASGRLERNTATR